ncbi:hypothetical protein [Escherichia phage Es2]|nr:hypothetical protein [Escherichia phage Es2]
MSINLFYKLTRLVLIFKSQDLFQLFFNFAVVKYLLNRK